MSSSEGVQATNDDATQCKRFAIQKGYWEDPYIGLFATAKPIQPRAPEINRGYYARVHGMKLLLDKFLQITSGKCQVVNIGAGFDTLYWRLCDENADILKYVDIDLPDTSARKCQSIRSKKALMNRLQQNNAEITFSLTDLHAHPYHLVAADVTKLPELDEKLIKQCDVDTSLPTVFLAECVLVYLPNVKSHELLRWISERFSSAFFINYEQVNMGDRFGTVMRENLRTRDCELLGVEACVSLDAQMQRFLTEGFEGSNALEMDEVYRRLPGNEISRIEKLEMLDDREVIDQLLSHYCISWAYRDGGNIGLSSIDM